VKFHKEARIDPNRLMSVVTRTEGAQFTPAGVLRLPIDGASAPGAVLDLLEGHLAQLKT
jgi:transcription-repair coupling factor (superfamily II helicase)